MDIFIGKKRIEWTILLLKSCTAIVNRKVVVLLHDNARSHYLRSILEKKWITVECDPVYFPHIATSDLDFFRTLQLSLSNKEIKNLGSSQNNIFRWFAQKSMYFYLSVIVNLHTRPQKVFHNEGQGHYISD